MLRRWRRREPRGVPAHSWSYRRGAHPIATREAVAAFERDLDDAAARFHARLSKIYPDSEVRVAIEPVWHWDEWHKEEKA